MNDYDDAPQAHRGLSHPHTSQRERLPRRDKKLKPDTADHRSVGPTNRGLQRVVKPQDPAQGPASVPSGTSGVPLYLNQPFPEKLTKDQILEIYRLSKGKPAEFKRMLGLGRGASDERLIIYLQSKGITAPPLFEREPTQWRYEGPSAGPLYVPDDWRLRTIWLPTDDPAHGEHVQIYATAEEWQRKQIEIWNEYGGDQAYGALAANAAAGGKGGASRAFIANATTPEGTSPRTEPTNGVRANPWFGETRPEWYRADVAARHLQTAERRGVGKDVIRNPMVPGSGLKADPEHRMASFLTEKDLASAVVTPIKGGDGVLRTLVQVPSYPFEGKIGIVEYIIDTDGVVTHQRFIEGGVVGAGPNKK